MSSPPSEQDPLPRPLVEAWRAAKPVAPELQRGYSRFLRRQKPRRSASAFARWVIGGVLFGAGLAHAATTRPWRAWTANEVVAPQPVRAVAKVQPSLPIAPQPSLPVAPMPAPTPIQLADAPELPRKPALASKLASPAAAPSAVSFRVQEQWRLAAEGLRTGNSKQAERALLELERSAHGGEREAAQLARAQVLARQGNGGEALRLAAELGRSASSNVVRDKARELRRTLSKNVSEDRSPASPTGINQP